MHKDLDDGADHGPGDTAWVGVCMAFLLIALGVIVLLHRTGEEAAVDAAPVQVASTAPVGR